MNIYIVKKCQALSKYIILGGENPFGAIRMDGNRWEPMGMPE
jgi:hypothetical protein